MKKIVMIVSSLTGNTKKIADAMEAEIGSASLTRFTDREVLQTGRLPEADLYIVCFWTRKSGMNDTSKKVVDLLTNQRIAAAGTMGNIPSSDYGQLVRKNVEDYISQKNQCVDVFLSQGKIPEARTEARRKLPKTAPHYLDEEGYKRHLESRKHPDADDLRRAADFIRKLFY
ncbi:MAG: flavodoxin family protein [Bilifractor sp.]